MQGLAVPPPSLRVVPAMTRCVIRSDTGPECGPCPAGTECRPRPAGPGVFWRDENGSLTILGLFMFVLMLVAGGVALDAMRAERQRADLQTTIDRGVLAATSLDQTRPGDVVMRDYLRAAGIPQDSVRIEAFDNGSERSVAVDAVAVTPSLFMNVLGIKELTQPIRASAIEVRTEVELSLVVDISGSMAQNNRITLLRAAAKEFVGKLLQGREDRTYVSLVPYNEWVNLGSTMTRYFPLADTHDLSRCVVFSDEAFRHLDLPAGEVLTRKGHFDRSNGGNGLGAVTRPECAPDDYAAVLPWSSNVTELRSQIDTLNAVGSTAINVGAKVGLLLLDPSSRPRLTAMINDGTLPVAKRVDPVFLDRPVDYRTVGTHKVLVLMTDGVNNTQRDLRPEFKSGPSTVYVFQERKNQSCDDDGIPDDCLDFDPAGPAAAAHPFGTAQNPDVTAGNYRPRYSFWSESRGQYYVSFNESWADAPYGGTEAMQLGWQELLAAAPTRWLVNSLLARSDAATKAQYNNLWYETHIGNAAADRNLADVCAAARAQGVIVYAIAFQAPWGGRKAMKDCAGTENPDRYFDVQGLDIDSAFDDILASVSRLRLTR